MVWGRANSGLPRETCLKEHGLSRNEMRKGVDPLVSVLAWI